MIFLPYLRLKALLIGIQRLAKVEGGSSSLPVQEEVFQKYMVRDADEKTRENEIKMKETQKGGGKVTDVHSCWLEGNRYLPLARKASSGETHT